MQAALDPAVAGRPPARGRPRRRRRSAAKPASRSSPTRRRPNPSTVLVLAGRRAAGRPSHWLLRALPRRRGGRRAPALAGRALADVAPRPRPGRRATSCARTRPACSSSSSGDDLTRLAGEVEKAALAGGPENRRVGVAEVRAVVGEHRLRHVFELTRALSARDARRGAGAARVAAQRGRGAARGARHADPRGPRDLAGRGRAPGRAARAEEIARSLRRPPAAAAALLERARSAVRRGARRGSSRAAGRSSGASSWAGRRAPSCRCSSPICARSDGAGARALVAAALLLVAGARPRRPPRPRRACSAGAAGVDRASCPRARRSPATAGSRAARGSPISSAATPTRSGSGPSTGVHDPIKVRAPRARGGRRAPALARAWTWWAWIRRSSPTCAARLDQLGAALRGGDRGRLAHALRARRLRATRRCSACSPLDRESPRGARTASSTAMERRGAPGRAPQAPGRRRRRAEPTVPGITESRVRRAARPRAGRAQGDGRGRPPGGAGVELRHPRHRARARATSCSPATSWATRPRVSRSSSGCPRSSSTARSAT